MNIYYGLDRTYEELKLVYHVTDPRQDVQVWIVPMRN